MPKRARHKPPRSVKSAPALPARDGRFQVTVLLLAAVGLLLWLAIGNGHGIGPVRWGLIACAAGIGCIPPVANGIARAFDRFRRPTARARQWTALIIGVAATSYLIFTAFGQGRDLFPKTNDDCSYLIGMQMLARGRLWMPPLAILDFFDSFHILVRPVYCSLYFPGAALLYVPTIWLDWPTYLMPTMVAGAVA